MRLWKYDGRPERATHQQLSNYIWWHIGIMGNKISYTATEVAEIISRFNNKILPYRPDPRDDEELLVLIAKGLIYATDTGHTLIIYNKRVIGEVLKSTHPIYSSKMGL